jgi:hypothetical protein
MTSGLVAYFLGKQELSSQLRAGGRGNFAMNVKNYLISQAYRYDRRGPLIVNNGELQIYKNAACSPRGSPGGSPPVRRGAGLVKRDGFDLTTTAFKDDQVRFSEIQILDEC